MRTPKIDSTAVEPGGSTGRLYHVRPTLLIGLGGSGKEVLLRLRRLFEARHKRPDLPIIEFLWIDTDIVNKSLDGTAYDEITRRVELNADERIDARMTPQEVEGYYQAVRANPHIFSWFPSELSQLGSSILVAGAGQIRPFGRLAFHHKFSVIRDRIQSKLQRMGNAERRREAEGMSFRVDNRMEVVVVTSLAGGTGSGMFIDLGFLLGHLRKNLNLDLSTTGIFFLPDIFTGKVSNAEPLMANSFAALMELGTFMAPRVGAGRAEGPKPFVFSWTREMDFEVHAPPFETAYLIDRKNLSGEHSEDFVEPFQMVAEFISLDFEQTRLAQQKRSNRSNMDQYLATDSVVRFYDEEGGEDMGGSAEDQLIYAEYFPNRFSTFGLCQILLDQDNLRNAAGFRLSELLADFWLKDVEPPRGFRETVVDKYLKKAGLERGDLLRELLKDEDESKVFTDSWRETVHRDFEGLVSKVVSGFAASSRKERLKLGRRMDANLKQIEVRARDLYRKRVEQARSLLIRQPDAKGKHRRLIEANVKHFEARAEERLENFVIDMLCDPTTAGTRMAEAFLEEAVQQIKDRAEEAKDDQPVTERHFPELSPPSRGGRLAEVTEDLSSVDNINSFLTLGYGLMTRAAAKNHIEALLDRHLRRYNGQAVAEIRGFLDEVKKFTIEQIEAEYDRVALNEAADVLGRLGEFVGNRVELRDRDGGVKVEVEGLHAKLFRFKQRMLELKQEMHSLYEAYRKTRHSVRNRVLSIKVDFVTEIEKVLQGRLGNRDSLVENLRRVSQRFFVDRNLVRSPSDSPLEGHEGDLFREGMRAIYERASNYERDRGQWLEVRNALEEFTFDQLESFSRDLTAAELWRREHPTDEELARELGKCVAMAAPYVEWGDSNQTLEAAGRVQTMAIVGIEEPEDPLVDIVRSQVHISGVNYYERASGEEHRGGSIVLFVEKVAFPTFYIGNLARMRRHYIANLKSGRDNLFHRHIDKATYRFRDIDPPRSDSAVKEKIEALKRVVEGQVLGVLRYDKKSGFLLRMHKSSGRPFEKAIGLSLDEAVTVVASSSDIESQLSEQNETVTSGWFDDGDLESAMNYLGMLHYYLEEVFQQPERFVAGGTAGIFSLRHHVITQLYDEYSKVLMERTGLDGKSLAQDAARIDIEQVSQPLDYRDAEAAAALRSLVQRKNPARVAEVVSSHQRSAAVQRDFMEDEEEDPFV